MSSSTRQASYDFPPSRIPGSLILDFVLPPQAIPLLILLLLVVPIVLLTGESLFVPLFEWGRARLLSVAGQEPAFGELPTYFFIKLAAFLVLTFLGGFQLIMRIKAIYFTAWARQFPRPHPLHMDYQTDCNQAMAALIHWKIYQAGMVVMPPIVMGLVTFLVGLVELYLFNTFSDLSFIGLSVQLTIELFLIMILSLFALFIVLNSLWTALTSLFGDVVAATEPDLPNPIILQRCGRLAFCSPYSYILFPAYFILMGGILGEIFLLVSGVDIHQFITGQANLPLIFGVEALTIAWYLGFNYFKFYIYHQSLAFYYEKMPSQLKECFTPPPAPKHYQLF